MRRRLAKRCCCAKRRSVAARDWDSRRLVIDALAKAVSPQGSDLAAERFEHLHLFNLIGDPLLGLHFPRAMGVAATSSATAGSVVSVSGQAPCDGACTIELVADHDAAECRHNGNNSTCRPTP